jgi:segregation and condensation protein B
MDISKEKERAYLKKVEAALFISGRWLSLKDLTMLTDINPILVKKIVKKLMGDYGDGRAMSIIEKNDKWKMDVEDDYADMVNKLATGSAEFSKAEQETLAIIAYKQPIKQSVVVKIRGNKAYDHIKKFLDLGLLMGKKVGRTKELSLSEEFYNYFHVSEE